MSQSHRRRLLQRGCGRRQRRELRGRRDRRSGILYQYSSQPAEAPQATPFTSDALFTANHGCFDALHMQVSPDGSTLNYSTFLGGAESDRGYGVAVDPSRNVIISGLTYSTQFPVKNPAQNWPGNAGEMNGFVTKLSPGDSQKTAPRVRPASSEPPRPR